MYVGMYTNLCEDSFLTLRPRRPNVFTTEYIPGTYLLRVEILRLGWSTWLAAGSSSLQPR